MTAKTLLAAGKLLFGETWRHSFEDAFGLSNRTLRRMLKGEMPVPDGLALEIQTALRDKANKIDDMLDSMTV